ncbi:MAG: hypothetical protein IJ094_12830 [Bacilli bacterium]|nr:hypothetical protein [Bacilli bacterium]
MELNKDIYKKYLNCKSKFNNCINYIENYKQIEEARKKNAALKEIEKNIIKNLKSNIYGKLEVYKKSKYIDCNKYYNDIKQLYVINKKSKDDIILYLDFYDNIYLYEDIKRDGWKTERTKEGKLIWVSIYN